MYQKIIPCGRTSSTKYRGCLNPDHSFRTNKLIIKQIGWFRVHGRIRFIANYEIRCRICGHVRKAGEYLGWDTIKVLLTGRVY